MLGGLLENGNGSVGQRVPGLSRLPVVGNAVPRTQRDHRPAGAAGAAAAAAGPTDAEATRLTREVDREDAARASRASTRWTTAAIRGVPDGALPYDGADLNQPFDASFIDPVARERMYPPLPSRLSFGGGDIAREPGPAAVSAFALPAPRSVALDGARLLISRPARRSWACARRCASAGDRWRPWNSAPRRSRRRWPSFTAKAARPGAPDVAFELGRRRGWPAADAGPAGGRQRRAGDPARQRLLAPRGAGRGVGPAYRAARGRAARPAAGRRLSADRARPRDVPVRRVVSRLKVMAGLDIAETRLPQDGRIALRLGGRPIDTRVSTLPGGFGERVVLRILDRNAGLVPLEALGLRAAQRRGSTGCRRGPTASSSPPARPGRARPRRSIRCCKLADRHERNIVTVEDPIEYDLPGSARPRSTARSG